MGDYEVGLEIGPPARNPHQLGSDVAPRKDCSVGGKCQRAGQQVTTAVSQEQQGGSPQRGCDHVAMARVRVLSWKTHECPLCWTLRVAFKPADNDIPAVCDERFALTEHARLIRDPRAGYDPGCPPACNSGAL